MEVPKANERTQVKPRRVRKFKVCPVGNYWSGFDENGHEKWFIELSDGRVLTQKHEEYEQWAQRWYPNTIRPS